MSPSSPDSNQHFSAQPDAASDPVLVFPVLGRSDGFHAFCSMVFTGLKYLVCQRLFREIAVRVPEVFDRIDQHG